MQYNVSKYNSKYIFGKQKNNFNTSISNVLIQVTHKVNSVSLEHFKT